MISLQSFETYFFTCPDRNDFEVFIRTFQRRTELSERFLGRLRIHLQPSRTRLAEKSAKEPYGQTNSWCQEDNSG